MRCPFCHTDNDRVIDTRPGEEGYVIRRRRLCLNCQRRYTTQERVENISIRVVKKDRTREPFDRDKVRQGLAKACWKRPVGSEQIETVVAAVEREIHDTFDSEVSAAHIGALVMGHLRSLDQVAYVRFASVYRQFQDARDFATQIEPMLATREETSSPETDSPR